MEHPNKYAWPDRGDKVYTLLMSVAAYGMENETRWNQALQVVMRAAQEGMPDMAAVAAKQLLSFEKARSWKRTVSLAPLKPLLVELSLIPGD